MEVRNCHEPRLGKEGESVHGQNNNENATPGSGDLDGVIEESEVAGE